MKLRTIVNGVIICIAVAVPAAVILPSYISFYFGGKEEFEAIAEQINERCNSDNKCPEYLEGWRPGSGPAKLRKDHMYYYYYPKQADDRTPNGNSADRFRLVFGLAGPDHWYEASGGVGKQTKIGWQNR